MSLQNKINEDIKSSLKNSDAQKLAVLRVLKNAITNESIRKGNVGIELNDLEVIALIRKQITQREDSVSQFLKGNRQELADKETAEIVVLQEYLPQALTSDEVITLIEGVIVELNASSKKDMGKVIKRSAELANGRVDNKTLSSEVARILGV